MGGGGGLMERYLREVIGNLLTLNSSLPPFHFWVYNIFVDKTYVWRFSTSDKFDCLSVGIFWSFHWFVTLIFDKFTPLPWIYVSKDALNHFLVHSSAKKTVFKELKYVIFLFFCTVVNRPMGGGGYSPPPFGYVTAPVTGNYRNFLKKITILVSVGSHFEHL